MINPSYFTDRAMRVGFDITLESHHINLNHANPKLTINRTFPNSELKFVLLRKS